MPLWFILTIAGLVSVAIADVSQKFSLKGESPLSSITNNFLVWNFIGVLALIYLLTLNKPFYTITPDLGLQLAPLAVFYFLGGTFYYQSFKSNSVSLSAVLATISSVITTILGIIFYGESSNVFKFIGSLIVLSAIILVNYQRKIKFDKYNLYALLGGIFYGISYTLDKHFVLSWSPDFYQMVLCFTVGFSSLIFAPRRIVVELKQFTSNLIPSIISSVVFFFLYQKFLFWAFTYGGEVGRIDVLNNTTVFIVILLEIILLKDHKDLKKKILSASIATIGATILVLAK